MSYYVLQPVFAGLLIAAGGLMGILAFRAFGAGRLRAGLRRAGWTLVPFGLLAVGVAGLGARVVAAVSRWAFGLVFSPVSWLGVALIVTGGVLVLLTRERGEGLEARTPQSPPQAGARDPYAPLPPSAAPSTAPSPAAKPGTAPSRKRGSTDPGASGLLAELEEMGLLDDDR